MMFIGISGGSGSGKTSFIQELKNTFGPADLGVISEDNYYKEWKYQLKDENGVINFDIPEAIDHEALIQDLQALQLNQTIVRDEYTFNNPVNTSKKIIIHPAKVYILEGLFIFHQKTIRDLLSLKVLIHAKDELKIIRRINRDQNERNYPIDDVLYRYQHHVAPAYQNFIQPYIEDLDLIINNNRNFNGALALFKAYIREIVQ